MPLPGHSGTIFRCRLQQATRLQPACGAGGMFPQHPRVAVGWSRGLPSPAARSAALLWGGQAQSRACRTAVYPAQPPLSPARACAAPSCHCERLSPQDPVSWSTTDKPGMSTASYAAAASSPSGHDPSSQTRRIITVSPVMRASLLLAALVAKRYVWPESLKPRCIL